MKAIKFLPIPLIVAVLAFIWMVMSAKLNFLAWVAFLTWGAYFLAGINNKSVIRELVSFTLGIVFGWAIVLIGTSLTPSLSMYAFPAAVALAAFLIVYLELVPWFDMAPGYFFGAAAFFAAGAKPDMATFLSVWTPGLLGLILGVLTGYLRGMVFKIEGSKDPLAK